MHGILYRVRIESFKTSGFFGQRWPGVGEQWEMMIKSIEFLPADYQACKNVRVIDSMEHGWRIRGRAGYCLKKESGDKKLPTHFLHRGPGLQKRSSDRISRGGVYGSGEWLLNASRRWVDWTCFSDVTGGFYGADDGPEGLLGFTLMLHDHVYDGAFNTGTGKDYVIRFQGMSIAEPPFRRTKLHYTPN